MLNPKNLLPGKEQHEVFFTGVGRRQKEMVQYDYRAADGELFSCVRLSLEACRVARDEWLLASGRARGGGCMSTKNLTEHEFRCSIRYEKALRLVEAINARSYLQYELEQGVAFTSWTVFVRTPGMERQKFIDTSAHLAVQIIQAVGKQAGISDWSLLI